MVKHSDQYKTDFNIHNKEVFSALPTAIYDVWGEKENRYRWIRVQINTGQMNTGQMNTGQNNTDLLNEGQLNKGQLNKGHRVQMNTGANEHTCISLSQTLFVSPLLTL